mmetsp:Transcript_22622/g.59780  ORF Transcript_22622/g.59780 Transcript_22622/m.59780 type:complete len:308 (-) Transcript_22622:57-980(-)
MYEQRAVCSACKLPLGGDLAASACNHVFHRRCLAAEDLKECPRCSGPLCPGGAFKLFGMSFGKGKDLGDAAMAARIQAAVAAGETLGEGMRTVTQILALRAEVQDQQDAVQEAEARRTTLLEGVKAQQDKLDGAERKEAKVVEERLRVDAQLAARKEQHRSLCVQADQHRQRDAVLEYWNHLISKSAEESLGYLTRFVGMVSDPAKTLAEVGKLRDHYRSKLATWQKEGTTSAQRLKVARAAIVETQRKVDELQRELHGGSPGKARRGAKRLRSDELDPFEDDDPAADPGPSPVRAPAPAFPKARRL